MTDDTWPRRQEPHLSIRVFWSFLSSVFLGQLPHPPVSLQDLSVPILDPVGVWVSPGTRSLGIPVHLVKWHSYLEGGGSGQNGALPPSASPQICRLLISVSEGRGLFGSLRPTVKVMWSSLQLGLGVD